MTQNDKTFWQCFKTSHVYGIEGTQSCPAQEPAAKPIPFYGPRPSGARAYSIAMPLNGLLIYLSARQKRRGDGKTACSALYLSSAVQFFSASRPVPWPVRIHRTA
jgi:hypothetical protein